MREFGLGPINIPPPPPQGQGHQQGSPPVPINFPPQQQPQQQQQPQTPPPFNFAEYGIPTDIGTATLTAAGNPYGQQQQPQQTQPFLGLGGGNAGGSPAADDFGIFGNGNQNNNNNNLNIPILEDGNNNRNNQNQLGIPLFGGGGGNNNNNNNDFNFGNDFNVAASDFAPFNFRNFVPEELTSISPESLGIPPPDAGNSGQLNPPGHQDKQLTKPLQPQLLQKVSSKKNGVVTPSGTGNKDEKTGDNKETDMQRRRMMYGVKEKNSEQAKKRTRRQLINERQNEKPLKEDPNSAWYILNMDPEFTNPNQGVYSYYPAYRMPS